MDEWETNIEVRQQWMEYGVFQLDAFLGKFSEVYEIPFEESIWRRSIDLIARYRLRGHDAVHAATALQAGLQLFATNDDHFRRVDALDVIIVREN